MTLRVHSEIGKLSSVLVHLPGAEIDRMVPAMMEELLFDDILFGARAREEHRRFQQVLGYVADEVLRLSELLRGGPRRPGASRRRSWKTWPDPPVGHGPGRPPAGPSRRTALASALVTGIEKPPREAAQSSSELYWLPPVPNYFFQRDPLVVVGDRVIRGSMATPARLREPLLSGYIFQYHPRFARRTAVVLVPRVLRRLRAVGFLRADAPDARGGDVIVLRSDLLAIGYSERTEKTTIERLAEALKAARSPVKRIFVVAIPPARSTMHLDTVFTDDLSGTSAWSTAR